MKKILVTGGTGTLGKEVVRQLLLRNYQVKVLSSQDNPGVPAGVQIAKGDLATKSGLNQAMKDSNIIIHCASNPLKTQSVDVEGTRNLLETVNKGMLEHFIYISIVGVDKSQFPYYQAKYEVEKIIEASTLPFTILRATQFHDFVLKWFIQPAARENEGIIKIPANMRFQSIDIREVTVKVLELVKNGPANSTTSIGGPQILTLEEMTRIYLNATQKKLGIVIDHGDQSFPVFRSGINLCPENTFGEINWEQYLKTVI